MHFTRVNSGKKGGGKRFECENMEGFAVQPECLQTSTGSGANYYY